MGKLKFNKNLVRSILLGIAAILIGVFVKGQLEKKDTKATPKISFRSKSVVVSPAELKTIPMQLEVNGRLKATNRMELFSEVSGVLKNNNFKSGQRFNRGQVIARIDDSEYRSQIIAARSTFMGVLSQSLADISLDYPEEADKWNAYLASISPNKSLPQLPTISSSQLKQFLSGRNILSNYYSIKSQEVRLNKYTITAPYAGVLSETSIDPGTLVRVGQKLGSFIQQNSYELEAAVAQNNLGFLRKGSKVSLRSKDLNKTFTGTVSRINSAINPSTQLTSVFLTVSGKELKEGLYLDAIIDAGVAQEALEVDRNTLIDGKAIYTVTKDSMLSILPVKVLSFLEEKAIINGVPSNTWIPVNQLTSAFEGMKVVPQINK